MKRLSFILFFLGTFAAYSQTYFSPRYEYKVSQKVYLFGDDVKLRAEPNTQSEVLTLLKIGEAVTIEEKTELTLGYNGFASPWYKVSHKGKTGYVLGALLSLDKKKAKTSDVYFLFSYKKVKERTQLLIRTVKDGQFSSENTLNLLNTQFEIKLSGNKGLEGIKNILQIDYYSEACGMNGGISYFFFDGDKLIKAIETSVVSEAGIFWFSEELKFPNEQEYSEGRIIYKKSQGESIDESKSWTEEKITTISLEWKDGKLTPDVQKLEDEKE